MSLIFHIDVNSAFLSWSAIERLKKDPSLDLRTIPAIIGGDEKSRHGVVLAKSIPAKKFGICTGEPVATALRKCPFLHMEPPDHTLYHKRSHELMNLLHTYTPDIEQVSIDECYLDFAPIAYQFTSPETAAREIADRVRDELGFTVNIGIAPNKVLAKMASDFEKPDKVHTLFREEIPKKMWPLPVSELFMVGHSSADRLVQLGIRTIGELANTDLEFLQVQFKSHGKTMWEYANGIDDSLLDSVGREAKGIGNSTTLAADVRTREEARRILLQLSEQVAVRLRKAHQLAQTVTLEIKYNDFRSCSRQTQLSTPISTSGILYDYACRLFDELWNGNPVRLLGVRTSKLLPEDTPIQLSLFDSAFALEEDAPIRITVSASADSAVSEATAASNVPASSKISAVSEFPVTSASALSKSVPQERTMSVSLRSDLEKQKRLEQAMDSIRKRYGTNAVIRGSLMKPSRTTDESEDFREFSLTQCQSKRKIYQKKTPKKKGMFAMEKKNIDWANLGFGYIQTDKRFVSNYKNGAWDEGTLTSDATVTITECAGVLQYAQTCFEGMKAYTTEDGHIVTFRPDLNAERMEASCKRLEMPVFPQDRFVDAVVKTVEANEAYVPPYGSGATLYIRPYMFGSDAVIGVKPAKEYQFRIFATPVGPYFKGGAKPLTLRVCDFDRAAPHGTGHIKAGLNYAMSLYAIVDAHNQGYDENMYLDAATRTKVEETGGANFLFVTKDNKVVTPKSSTILPSITRRSLLYVAKEYLGLEVEEREVYFDEVKDFAEAGLCGTAAVISPVGKIVDHGNEICLPAGMAEMGPITKKLYDTLTGIQMGRIEAPKGWIKVIK